jgi:hypothetical protein
VLGMTPDAVVPELRQDGRAAQRSGSRVFPADHEATFAPVASQPALVDDD